MRLFDMNTGDPDDILTLLFLCSHPAVDLRAVTITPGSEEQVALVRWILQEMGMTGVRLGAQEWPKNKTKSVNLTTSFYRSFGRQFQGKPVCESASEVLRDCCGENVTLVTGGPLHNLGAALQWNDFRLGRWVAQGGFAGEGVVPRDMQMDKFKGKEVCSTWNSAVIFQRQRQRSPVQLLAEKFVYPRMSVTPLFTIVIGTQLWVSWRRNKSKSMRNPLERKLSR